MRLQGLATLSSLLLLSVPAAASDTHGSSDSHTPTAYEKWSRPSPEGHDEGAWREHFDRSPNLDKRQLERLENLRDAVRETDDDLNFGPNRGVEQGTLNRALMVSRMLGTPIPVKGVAEDDLPGRSSMMAVSAGGANKTGAAVRVMGTGPHTFIKQYGPDDTAATLLGGQDIGKLRRGKFGQDARDTERALVSARLGILDEFSLAQPFVLLKLLSLIHEGKVFDGGGTPKSVKTRWTALLANASPAELIKQLRRDNQARTMTALMNRIPIKLWSDGRLSGEGQIELDTRKALRDLQRGFPDDPALLALNLPDEMASLIRENRGKLTEGTIRLGMQAAEDLRAVSDSKDDRAISKALVKLDEAQKVVREEASKYEGPVVDPWQPANELRLKLFRPHPLWDRAFTHWKVRWIEETNKYYSDSERRNFDRPDDIDESLPYFPALDLNGRNASMADNSVWDHVQASLFLDLLLSSKADDIEQFASKPIVFGADSLWRTYLNAVLLPFDDVNVRRGRGGGEAAQVVDWGMRGDPEFQKDMERTLRGSDERVPSRHQRAEIKRHGDTLNEVLRAFDGHIVAHKPNSAEEALLREREKPAIDALMSNLGVLEKK